MIVSMIPCVDVNKPGSMLVRVLEVDGLHLPLLGHLDVISFRKNP